ncbi:uncharacterized protein [Miscanthus floridulus]|uniref:uncharacterized protein n=1 Tax=Miscanthus floridulus TaxID=154761 RepID=UPI003457B934
MASPPSINNGNYDPKTDKARKAKSNDLGWKYGYWANLQNQDRVTCTLCDIEVCGGIKRLKQHLAGGYGDVKMCLKTTTAIRKEMRDYLESNMRRRPLFLEEGDEQQEEADVVVLEAGVAELTKVGESAPEGSQTSRVQPSSGTAAKQRRAAYLFKAPATKKTKYVPPNPHLLGEPLLNDVVKLTSNVREEHEQAWKQYGCTLMSDGWTDRRSRHLINFLVNSPEGTYFIESVDASAEVHDAFMLADLLGKKIDEIGKEKVVQVITDNGANYKAAGRILMERIPTLFWSPCDAHCLDLMMEEIGKLQAFKKTIALARRITTFIYMHGRILSLMREKTGGADLVRPAATRFATSFLTLKSLHKHKDALNALFHSEEWSKNKLAKTNVGDNVHSIIFSIEFWNSVEDCLRALAPLLIVLRVVDGDEKPRRAGRQELHTAVGCAGIHLRSNRAGAYPLMRLSTSNKGWHSQWFYVKNDAAAPLLVFTGRYIVETLGSWGWGVMGKEKKHLNDLLATLQTLKDKA